MLTKQSHLSKGEIRNQLGWDIKPEGACQGEWCLLVSIDEETAGFEVKALAKALHMPLVEEPELGLLALGPGAVAGCALTSAKAPELALPDINWNITRLSDFLGQKMILHALAPY